MNSFNNDGSFLERFKAMQQKTASAPSLSNLVSESLDDIKTEPCESSGAESSGQEVKSNKSVRLVNDGRFLKRFKLSQRKTGIIDTKWGKSDASCKSDREESGINASLSVIKREIIESDNTSSGSSLAKLDLFDDGADDSKAVVELDSKTWETIKALAKEVSVKGIDAEDNARTKYKKDPAFWFLYDQSSVAYKLYKEMVSCPVKIDACLGGEGSSAISSGLACNETTRPKKRKSRWDTDDSGNKVTTVSARHVASKFEPTAESFSLASGSASNVKSEIFDFDQEMVGSSVEEVKKQMLEQAQLRIIQQRIEAKRAAMKAREQAVLMGKAKPVFEYDSDEEADCGTWEHKLRKMEMEKTRDQAEKLTSQAEGKHHISQFLPPDELERFLKTYQAGKDGQTADRSDYQEAKLTEENKGFKLLQKMGWTEGRGLGVSEQGIIAPINKGRAAADNEGLGASSSNDLSGQEDAFDLYRKRMMLAYRFRPNPLNNPRRPYY